jgi:dCTP deaminase
MILTGPQIEVAHRRGELAIEPFDPKRVSPNAYDFRLDPRIRVVHGDLDAKQPVATTDYAIPPQGVILQPGVLYLGLTLERTGSRKYAQHLFGDHSTGSLGIFVHVSAPLGHAGHDHCWTLEIKVVKPVIVYPGMTFGKLVFLDQLGDGGDYKAGAPKYTSDQIQNSQLYLEAATWTN